MIATITVQSHRMPPPKEHHFSPRNVNTASAPLPLIPRRTLSTSRSHNALSSSSPVKLTIQPSTPEVGVKSSSSTAISDSDSSSSSSPSDGTRPTIRARRIRGVRSSAVCPPEHSTPIPAIHNARLALDHRQPQSHPVTKDDDSTPRPTTRSLIYAPGVSLKFQTEALKSRNFSESRVRASTESPASVASTSTSQPRLIRKKSGQLVKSSLKTSKSKDSLSVITLGISSKSEPNTPTHAKAVHFDSKLEHVKLFLAEQKPLAVSRDGSPTEDTSGTDNDFPSFIFGDSDGKPRKTLVMHVPNMPPGVNLNADVALEELTLSADATSILGRVRVRNIAYAKWLAVRFTFDSWQTTSEVTARYTESIDGDFDRFSFSIRLNDLLARIEGKTLYLALRYTVAGRDFWDNNGGNNYLAEFTKVMPVTEKHKSSEDEGSTESDIADLRSKLEKVVQGRGNSGSSFLTPSTSRDSGLGAVSLASRYDFGTSLAEPWKPSDFTSPPCHIRTQSYPASTVSTPNSIPWPEKSKSRGNPTIKTIPLLGSPRDVGEDALFSAPPRAGIDTEDAPFTVNGPPFRNHRRGYFDDANILEGSSIRRTPPGTPYDSTPLPSSRFHSFPPVEGSRPTPPYGLGFIPTSAAFTDSSEGSDQSTPSFFSPSSTSSRSTTPSPTESFMICSFVEQNDKEQQVSPNTNYRQFLNKFCFFTGSEGSVAVSPEVVPRTQSASDIEELLTGVSPRINAAASCFNTTPARSPSLDDVVRIRSGSSTPTAPIMSPILSGSRSATPIAV